MAVLHCTLPSLDIVKSEIDKAVQFVFFLTRMAIYLLLIVVAC